MRNQTVPGRVRGRLPNPAKVAQTRRAILEAALEVFLARGFEGTRMADVAARAGIAKGTLYLHFADKEALFEFALRELVAAPLERARLAPIEDESPRAVLERLLLPLLRDLEESGRGTVLRLIIAEGSRVPALAALHRRLVIDPVIEIVQEQARRAIAQGNRAAAALLRFPQLAGAPIVLVAVWNGLWGGGERLDPAAVFTAFLDLVFPLASG